MLTKEDSKKEKVKIQSQTKWINLKSNATTKMGYFATAYEPKMKNIKVRHHHIT